MLWNTAVEIAGGFLPEYVWRMMMKVGNYVPRVVVAILILIVGIKLIKGKKAQLVQRVTEDTGEAAGNNLRETVDNAACVMPDTTIQEEN